LYQKTNEPFLGKVALPKTGKAVPPPSGLTTAKK